MKRKQFLRYMGAAFGGAALTPFLTACNDSDDPVATSDTTTPPATTTPPPTVEVPPATTPPPATTSLSAEEIAGLKFMR
jgi:hypothetical protein